jgi:hypothetical protein
MNRATTVLAFLAFLAAFAFWHHAPGGTAAAATPTPAALQYDEINRIVVAPNTPPPPGSFSTDYQAVVASAGNPTPAPQHGLGSMLNAVMGPGGSEGAVMQFMRVGHLVRYTFYMGWVRTDDPAMHVATISKCDQHQFITLNLANKTYTETNTQPACASPMMPAGDPMHYTPQRNQAGTADMTISSTSQNLGPLTIDGVQTTGSSANMSMNITNATGSCRNGDMQLNATQYVSTIAQPRAYCPLPGSLGSAPAAAMSAQGGCKPTMHVTGQGSNLVEPGDRVVMYRLMAMPSVGRGSMVVERGNVKWLSGADAEALFTIPEGFTQAS